MKPIVRNYADRIRDFLISPIMAGRDQDKRLIQTLAQNNLTFQYRQMLKLGLQMPRIDEVGFSVYSESNEDGILHYIFALVGTVNKELADIGAASIKHSNTANLIINQGWTGLLIDQNSDEVENAKRFYSRCAATRLFSPRLVCSRVTAENVNHILTDNELTGEIDLLCIDIDGIDYWIWKAIDCISPRVVVVEYQCIWGPKESVTVPYKPDFKAGYSGRFGIYNGASLLAFVKLGKEKRYRLVGCQRYGYNAFFVRNDIGQEVLPETPPAECFKHPFTQWARKTFLDQIKDKEWVEV